uniref:Secreted protein n=1 Tax=Parascaris univalens TaxID=6257 RepID=A0A915A307_PARUN
MLTTYVLVVCIAIDSFEDSQTEQHFQCSFRISFGYIFGFFHCLCALYAKNIFAHIFTECHSLRAGEMRRGWQRKHHHICRSLTNLYSCKDIVGNIIGVG